MFAAASTPPVAVPIADVQGTGASTPLAGHTVTVDGIVTATLPGLGGMYVQSAKSSAVAGASDGIFVRTRHIDVNCGDRVAVTGVAGEIASQTQIAADSVRLMRASVGLPAATPLPATVVGDAREAYEGMLVTPTGAYYLDAIDNPTGSLRLSAGSRQADAANRILLDDGTSAAVSTQPYLVPDSVITAGDTLVAPKRPLVLAAGASGYVLEPSMRLDPSSALSYKPKFSAATPRLGGAPTVAP
jgi:predicted extracellular nuclease